MGEKFLHGILKNKQILGRSPSSVDRARCRFDAKSKRKRFFRLAEGQFYFSHKWVLFSRVEGVLAIISPRRAKKAAVRWFRAIFRRQGFVWGVVKADIED
jgi:hypothetical protein